MEENVVTKAPKREKKKWTFGDKVDLLIVIFLGITALLTAWASWISALHGGNQATYYTESNNLAADGNARWNEASQTIMQDMILWSSIDDLQVDILLAQESGDEDAVVSAAYKLYFKCVNNFAPEISQAVGWEDAYYDMDGVEAVLDWMEKPEATQSPFFEEDFVNVYYEDAAAVLEESEVTKEKGQRANQNGDALGLVTVLYSVVLFLLGIAGSFKKDGHKYAVVGISMACFVIATIYMFTIPLPDGFSMASFFGS